MYKILVAPSINRGALICTHYELTDKGIKFLDTNGRDGFVPYQSFGAVLPMTAEELEAHEALEAKLKAEAAQLREAADQTELEPAGKTISLNGEQRP